MNFNSKKKQHQQIWTACFLVILLWLLPVPADDGQPALPFSAQRLLSRVNGLVEKNQIQAAIAQIRDFDGKGKDHFMIYYTLGNCHMLADQVRPANAAYKKAVAGNPGYCPAWYNLAKSYMELDEYAQGALAFEKAYECYDPKKPETLYYAASSYLAGDLPEKALALFKRLETQHPAAVTLEWRQVQVQILLANDRPKTALPVIEELAEKMTGAKQKEWQEFLLYHYLTLEMEKKALAYAEKLSRKDPLEPKWWKALCRISLSQDQYRKALVALEVYRHLATLDLSEKKLRADLYLMLDIPEQAVAVLEKLLEEKPDAGLTEKLVYSLTARHQTEAALSWIDKALASEPNNIKLRMLKGEVLFQLKSYRASEQAFQAVLDLDRHHGKAWLMLGYAAWYGQNIDSAIAAMEQAIKFPRQEKSAREALAGLKSMQKQAS